MRVSSRPYFSKYKQYNGEIIQKPQKSEEKSQSIKLQEKKADKRPAEMPANPPASVKTDMEKIEKALDAKTLAVYKKIPLGQAVTVDELCDETLTASDIITAMTMLQIHKCVVALPGARYTRT